MQSTVPARPSNTILARLCEKSSFRRKYSEIMSSRRTRIKIKNFFINKKRKAAPRQPFPKHFSRNHGSPYLGYKTVVWLRPRWYGWPRAGWRRILVNRPEIKPGVYEGGNC